MNWKFRRALIASLILHSALAFFWWKHPAASRPPKVTVEVEFKEVPAAQKKSGGTVAGNSSATHTRADHQQTKHIKRSGGGAAGGDLRKFGATTLNLALKGGPPGAGKNLTNNGPTGLDENEWGSHGGLLGEIENFNQYEKLFQHIEGMLGYPGILGSHNLSDSVNSRLVFDENSHCDWAHSRVGGSHRYFRIYTASLLHRLCDLESIEHMHFKKGQFVDLSFNFVIIGLAEENPPDDFIQGNVLSFRRTFLRPHLEYHVGPITGMFGVPFVAIDFPWIFEHWDKWVEGKDPLREFKPAD